MPTGGFWDVTNRLRTYLVEITTDSNFLKIKGIFQKDK